jgi:hypothetical protein
MVTTITRAVFGQLAEMVLEGGVRKATKYLSPKLTIKAARRFKLSKRDSRRELVFTIGVPNYAERVFIKARQKAGEPFPVKRIQIQREKTA